LLTEQFSRLSFALAQLPASQASVIEKTPPLQSSPVPLSNGDFIEKLKELSALLESDISQAESLLNQIQSTHQDQHGELLNLIQQDLDGFDIDAALVRVKQQFA